MLIPARVPNNTGWIRTWALHPHLEFALRGTRVITWSIVDRAIFINFSEYFLAFNVLLPVPTWMKVG